MTAGSMGVRNADGPDQSGSLTDSDSWSSDRTVEFWRSRDSVRHSAVDCRSEVAQTAPAASGRPAFAAGARTLSGDRRRVAPTVPAVHLPEPVRWFAVAGSRPAVIA